MITQEQLQRAAQRTMIQLNEEELPALLHALQTLEPIADFLAQAIDAVSAPASACVAAFPDELRPDCVASSFSSEVLIKSAATVQEGYFVVHRQPVQKEDRP